MSFVFCFRAEQPKSRAVDIMTQPPITPWGIQINECYGMSESTAACTLSTQRCHLWGSCGFQLPGFEVKAFQVDPETWLAKGSMGRYVRNLYIYIFVCVFDVFKYSYLHIFMLHGYLFNHISFCTLYSWLFICVAFENPWSFYEAVQVRRRKEYLNEISYSLWWL